MNEFEAEQNDEQSASHAETDQSVAAAADENVVEKSEDVPSWAAGLSDANRQLVVANDWATDDSFEINRALDAYRELETSSLQSVAIPDEDATPEVKDAFQRRLGRPETPEGYEFELPDGLPDDFPYSEEMVGRFRDWAFRAGVPANAAQSLHDDYVREIADLHEAESARMAQAEEQSHQDLTAEWGAQDSEAYRRNVLLADRAMSELGLGEALREHGLIAQDGGVRDARIALALARIGSELFSEDGVFSGAGSAANPFSGDNPNLTEQSRLIREARQDPAQAAHVRALMQAAGIDPETQRF